MCAKKIIISLFINIGVAVIFYPQLCFSAAGVEGYPKIANWNYAWGVSDSEVQSLARWDLLIIDIEAAFYSPDQLRAIKAENPKIKILAYLSCMDIRPDAADALDAGTLRQALGQTINNSNWVLKNSRGEQITWWEDYYMLNITSEAPVYAGDRWQDYLPRKVAQRIHSLPQVFDGVFYDNLWEDISWLGPMDINGDGIDESGESLDAIWQAGMKKLLKNTRAELGDKYIVTGNGGVGYINQVNGIGFEHFPTTIYGQWVDSMIEYYYVLENIPLAILNTNTKNKSTPDNYQKMRYGLTSALLNNGYYNFDQGDQSHTESWWYDEYSVALGKPLADAYNTINSKYPNKLQTGVWRRNFTNGLVLVNSTKKDQKVYFETGFEKINGVQDPAVNNGTIVGSLIVPAKDGIILLGKLAQIENIPYINGGYAKVFNVDGSMERNSFYSYNSNYSGGVQIVELPDKQKTIVADETYIKVYKKGKLKTKFAPYGDKFVGGVNIAVDKLYKKDRRYYIVTGTQNNGPQVRIFSLKGKLKHPGCFPYAPSFQGGVNVAIGNISGDSTPEILVAAGHGGGPHIRILNNQCEVIDPGFFAYDPQARFGVNIGVGDVNRDGQNEIVTGPGPGGAPQIRIFNKNGKLLTGGFYAYSKTDTSGVLVGVTDIDDNGQVEIITSSFGIYNY